jgi:glycosyltransferase involved in cell wall biosynthesis
MKVLLTSEFTGLKTTGYSLYYLNLATALHKAGHKVIELASYGDENIHEHVEYAKNCAWSVYLNIPNNNDENNKKLYEERDNETHDSKFGSWQYERVCLSELPDVVISLRDYWYDKFIIDSPLSKYMNVILSPTCDARPQKSSWLDGFSKTTVLSSYNEWAENWLKTQYGGKNIIGAISPGVSPAYYPLDKNACKAKLDLPKNKRVLLTVMRNQGRKRFPELFEGFANFNDPNTILYCHTHHQDRGWELVTLATQCGILDRVYFTYKCKNCSDVKASIFNVSKKCNKCGAEMAISSVHDGVETEQMNTIYNSCDLYVQYANSEGLGYPQIEAAACGKRVLAINYSAMEDIIPKIGAIPLNYLTLETELTTGCKRAIPDTAHLVSVLKDNSIWDYNIAEIIEKTQKNYNWENTGKEWVNLVESLSPKNTWAEQFAYKQPLEFAQLKNLNNVDFVKNCFIHVARRPDLLGTYMHAEILNHLEVGSFIPEDKFTFVKSNFMIPIKKDAVYNRLRRMYETEMSWEKARVKRLQSLNKT